MSIQECVQQEQRLALRTEKQASEILNIPLATLRKWRCFRENLPFVKIGRSVRYRLSDLTEFLDKRTIQPRMA
ncbi:MAG: helix-turn-helix domain-containing protein [Desulfovibrio sp.]|nr:helix-turn-helix domain-containing protein [Desulfovibrio sp.]